MLIILKWRTILIILLSITDEDIVFVALNDRVHWGFSLPTLKIVMFRDFG